MGRLAALVPCVAGALLVVGGAGAQSPGRSWAAPHITVVVKAGIMASSAAAFRPQDHLTAGELADLLAQLGAPGAGVDDPGRPVTVRELDARLVTALGLRPEARAIRLAARRAGIRATTWLGTETVARLLGLRVNHPRESELLELQLSDPVTRAETAFSVARLLALRDVDVDGVRAAVATFSVPDLDDLQRAVLGRALRLVGAPYVWGGSSEREQRVGTALVPGGFDCSGLVWRVFKSPPVPTARGAGDVLRGRTSYAMSGEVPVAARVGRDALRPGDVVFFGARGPRSRPAEVGHMGIYVGNGWLVHSSRNGTTLQPLTGWYESTFAWGRNLFAEAGIAPASGAPSDQAAASGA